MLFPEMSGNLYMTPNVPVKVKILDYEVCCHAFDFCEPLQTELTSLPRLLWALFFKTYENEPDDRRLWPFEGFFTCRVGFESHVKPIKELCWCICSCFL